MWNLFVQTEANLFVQLNGPTLTNPRPLYQTFLLQTLPLQILI